MQDKLKLEILKEGYSTQKEAVESTLRSKARFVSEQWQRELTEPLMKRMKAEEEHIRSCVGLIETFESLIYAYEEELQIERGKLTRCRGIQEMFANEANEYREKYYMIILQLNEAISNRNTEQHRATGQS